jgi:ABC-type Zn uptake system ZnuABC Zn-binding protein ZnuA
MSWKRIVCGFFVSLLCVLSVPFFGLNAPAQSRPLEVCATVPDLGSLVQEIGGDRVSVTVFTKGTESAHFVSVKPGFVKAVSRADLVVVQGMELEIGWFDDVLRNARNPAVLPGSAGYVDASTVITPLEVPTTTVDRSMGDVHPLGNPHYLLDPLNGLKVAQLLRDRLARLHPNDRDYFEARYESFRKKLGAALVGGPLAEKYEFEKLVEIHRHGQLIPFLKKQGEESLLGGWIGSLAKYSETKSIGDHNQWIYFAERFRFPVVGYLEPKPGVPPSTRHLSHLVEMIEAQHVRVLLSSPYFDPRHAGFLVKTTGIKVAEVAHQVGSRPGVTDYISLFDYNVRTLAKVLGESSMEPRHQG